MTAKQSASRRRTFKLSKVLDALGDPTRRQILLQLAEKDHCCGSFDALGSKTGLTYHFNRLREAGLVGSTRDGRYLILTLRSSELETAFPGLLTSVLHASKTELASREG